MSSMSLSFRILTPQWKRHRSLRFFIFIGSQRPSINGSFVARLSSSSNNDDSVSAPNQTQLGFDPSDELLGLQVDTEPRSNNYGNKKPRSWFGPNGQYIRELPCPTCRGRGYTPCLDCGVERSRPDCSKCKGKGIITCRQCFGECVIWEESIDEQPWENARSISPLKMKEDDDVDNLDIKLDTGKKSKRVYQSPSPEVGLKISRSLKSLNAKTGMFSKRMKIIHRDPKLHAQRVAAIKKAEGTAAARKRTSEALKAFFSDPKNRRKRSISMIGVKFYCRHCGGEGHRRHYCPELKDVLANRKFTCRVCGEKGHNRRTCPETRVANDEIAPRRLRRCKACRRIGHDRRTCPKLVGSEPSVIVVNRGSSGSKSMKYRCTLCKEFGHNARTCPSRNVPSSENNTSPSVEAN